MSMILGNESQTEEVPITNELYDGNAKRQNSICLKQIAISSIEGFAENMDFIREDQAVVTSRFWYRLAQRSSLPETPLNELIRRSAFILMSMLTCVAGLIWCLMYLYLGQPNAAFYPATYTILLSNCFVFLTKQGRYHDIVVIQLMAILILPISLHIETGGVIKSGCVYIWSFLCPLGAALFCTPSAAKFWFFTYVMFLVALVLFEFWKLQTNTDSDTEPASITYLLLFTLHIFGALSITFFGALTFSERLEKEYYRSEKLLHNVLPRSIAKRLKDGESQIIDHFDAVSIIFLDLVGFTKASAEFHPNFLIGIFLRDVFSAWDQLCEAHSMEKIKTIGDAFMAVGGIETGGRTGTEIAVDMVLLGLKMQKALDQINKRYDMNLKCRIGVHSGPVIAGVIGVQKFAFDVWGDAVNTASRLESHGIPGYIHMSSQTYEKVKKSLPNLDIRCRGEIMVKGKGTMMTYLLKIPSTLDEEMKSYGYPYVSDSTTATSTTK